MARGMDQDLLPVLLTLGYMHRSDDRAPILQAWPGLLFNDATGEDEVDLLVSTGPHVTIFECKATAENLHRQEAEDHVRLARRLGAIPAVAAPAGTFLDDVRAVLTQAGGFYLEHCDLIVTPID